MKLLSHVNNAISKCSNWQKNQWCSEAFHNIYGYGLPN